MRVVYIHQYFRTPAMTGGTRSYEMARRLVQRGHEVHMVTSQTDPAGGARKSWTQTDEMGIRVHWWPVPYANRMKFSRRMRAFCEFAWRAASRAATLDGDVVFATSTPLTVALPGIHAARKSGVPFVFEVRDLWPELPIAVGALKSRTARTAARLLERYAYQQASHIVALSPGIKAGVMQGPVATDQVTVIPNSCDFDLFEVHDDRGAKFRQRYDWLGHRPLVVYTGTLGMINGVDYLPRLAAEMVRLNPEVRFLVVGSGQQESFIRAQAKRMDVLDRNFFTCGSVAKDQIPAVLSAADVATSLFIDLPEMRNNSANKFFDALAAGTPIVINHEGWLADLIRERGLGLVLDPADFSKAAQKLNVFLQNRERMSRAATAARRAGRELFDRDLLASRLENVLLNATGRAASRVRGVSELKTAA